MRIQLACFACLLSPIAGPALALPYGEYGLYDASFGSDDLRELQREYRRDLAEARRKCAEELRDADDRREYREEQQKCREEIAEVERDYRE